jgi:hypothetical protein
MVVLLLGACLSKSGLSWCTILNVPYVLFPLAVAVQCLAEAPLRPQTNGKPSWLDKALVVLLIQSSLAALLKGLVSACLVFHDQSFTTILFLKVNFYEIQGTDGQWFSVPVLSFKNNPSQLYYHQK